ncbi:diguanylate cyclase [Starkeya koreensis]|uniref:diguanylate cyclase n=1 Tax=Ancylobacter koreensis TaxID=266121 RepID=A0ABT0DNX8_9HYPH|nr:diguanylate cyclase [Ancylobacter koreensis]MCK0208986.1 diguanylate cyclase [Ancylobacter koreensis]
MDRDAAPISDAEPPLREVAFARAPVALCVVDRELRLTAANERMAVLAGRPAPDLAGCAADELLPGAGAVLRHWFARLLAGRTVSEREIVDPIGKRTFIVAATPVFDAAGVLVALTVSLTDITRRRELRTALARREREIGAALESAGQWIWELDIPSGRVERSRHWHAALGFEGGEGPKEERQLAWGIVHPEDRPGVLRHYEQVLSGASPVFEAVYRIADAAGRWRWILGRGRIVARDADGKPLRLLATSVDITRQKRIEEELEATVRQRARLERELVEANRRLTELSEMDALTELPNRRKFDKALTRELGRAGRNEPSLALVMIDVDDFKSYNDLYGHPEGDECLRRIAGALRGCAIRPADLVTRYGGEEFAAVLPDSTEADGVAVATAMLAAVRALRIPHAGSPHGIVTVSIGITVRHAERNTKAPATDLVAGADRALYAAKHAGRNRILIAGPDGFMRPVPVPEPSPETPQAAPPRAMARRAAARR